MTVKTRTAGRDGHTAAAVRTYDDGETRALALISSRVAPSRARRGGSTPGGSSQSRATHTGLFSAEQLRHIEDENPEGLTAAQIVDLFAARGQRFSEATFRKYVQLGLVPRSRRIGRKGKHRGSLGVYPAKAVRRINAVRRLMEEGRTIEEIQAELLRFADVLETLEEGLSDLFQRFDSELDSPRFDARSRKSITRELTEARQDADELLARLDGLSQRLGGPRGDTYGGTGAAGSAEELL